MPTVEYLDYGAVVDHEWDLDKNPFEQAENADLDEAAYGSFDVEEGEYILTAAEAAGHDWPFSCRNGVCSNCAAILVSGAVEMDGNQALNEEEVHEKDIRLTCISRPASDHIRLIFNAKRLDYLQDRVMY